MMFWYDADATKPCDDIKNTARNILASHVGAELSIAAVNQTSVHFWEKVLKTPTLFSTEEAGLNLACRWLLDSTRHNHFSSSDHASFSKTKGTEATPPSLTDRHSQCRRRLIYSPMKFHGMTIVGQTWTWRRRSVHLVRSDAGDIWGSALLLIGQLQVRYILHQGGLRLL